MIIRYFSRIEAEIEQPRREDTKGTDWGGAAAPPYQEMYGLNKGVFAVHV
jgi:hypothetical protein